MARPQPMLSVAAACGQRRSGQIVQCLEHESGRTAKMSEMRFDPDLLRTCWFLAGPTACGKTAAAIELAARIGAEIVALDSMSLYRAMDIGTAKPTPEQRAQVPHHLIDVLDPWEEFSVAEYLRAAERACRGIRERHHTPLFVGGTGLYLRALLRGVFEGPAADWDLRRALESELAVIGPEQLHARLRSADPTTADRLHPHDTRRVIRALEVHRLTGRPASELQQQHPLPMADRPRHVYWLEPPRDWLHDRINARVIDMIEAGLQQEVQALLAAPRPLSRTARQALGYAEMIEHIEGSRTLDDTVSAIQTATRQFAKRQHTWFRNLVECRVISITGNETPEAVAQLVLSAAKDGDIP